MGIDASLTIIAISFLCILLVLAVMAAVVIRTFLRLERVLALVEQDIAPLVLDAREILHDVQRMVRAGGDQVERVDATIRYLDRELRDSMDTLVLPVREIGLWYRSVRAGWRYFFRRR